MAINFKAAGQRIRSARFKANLTQETLSEMINISPSHMSNIETGSTNVSLKTMVNIANALSVSLDDLLCDSIVHSRTQMEGDIHEILNSCRDEYEVHFVKDLVAAILPVLRSNSLLKETPVAYQVPSSKKP